MKIKRSNPSAPSKIVPSIAVCRQTMSNRFDEDPDFAELYKAQIACFIMDNFPVYKRNKAKRDRLAGELFEKLYKE